MKTIKVIGTFLQPGAAHFSELLKDGKSVLSPVFFRDALGNKVEAVIDDMPIGFAEDGFEIPKLYDAHIVGAGPDPFSFIVDVDCAETSASGGDYAAEKALIDFDIVPEDEVDLMVKVMEANRVHPTLIARVLKERVANASEKRFQPNGMPIYQDGNPSTEFSYMNDAIICMLNGEGLLLEGEKSTGKNVLTTTLAWFNCKPYYRIGMSAGMDMDSVFGGKSTDNSAAEGLDLELAMAKVLVSADPVKYESYLADAAKFELLKAQSASLRIIQNKAEIVDWAKDGGVLLFDEINMAEANFLQALVHPLADGERVLVLPGGEGSIKLHPHCVLAGGMNPVGSDYAGTRELNEATSSRLARIQVEMPEDIESLLRANFSEDTKLGNRHFKACSSVYKDFKAAAERGSVSKRCLNIRGFVRALADVERFPEATSLAHRITIQVLNGCLPEERLVLDRMVRDKITF